MVPLHVTLVLHLALAATACSGGEQLGGSSLARRAGAEHTPAKAAPPDPAPAPPPAGSKAEGEGIPADSPVQVSGAFLVACGHARDGDGTFGCAVLAPDAGGTRRKVAAATLATVTVQRADGTGDKPAVRAAPASSPFHVLFTYDEDHWQTALGVNVAGSAGSKQLNLSDTRLAYDEPASGDPTDTLAVYASRVYVALDGRLPTAAEETALVGSLKQQTQDAAGRGVATLALARSAEGVTHTLADFARINYGQADSVRSLMANDATVKTDAAGVTGGTLAPIDALTDLLASASTYTAAGGTASGYATLLYTADLARTASSVEVQGWSDATVNLGRAGAAHNFLTTPEPRQAYVARWYKLLLRRSEAVPTLEAEAAVQTEIQAHDPFGPEVLADLTASEAFFKLQAE